MTRHQREAHDVYESLLAEKSDDSEHSFLKYLSRPVTGYSLKSRYFLIGLLCTIGLLLYTLALCLLVLKTTIRYAELLPRT